MCRDHTFDSGIIYGGTGKLLGMQVFGAFIVLAWVFLTVTPIFLALKQFDLLRIPTEVQVSVHVRPLSL